jgi:hypothetical protein
MWISEEHSRRLVLSLTSTLNRTTLNLMGKKWDEIGHSRKCDPSAFPWIDCRYEGRGPDLARSINQNQWDWLLCNLISLNRSRDIATMSNLKKSEFRIIHRLIWFFVHIRILFVSDGIKSPFARSRFIDDFVNNHRHIPEVYFTRFML